MVSDGKLITTTEVIQMTKFDLKNIMRKHSLKNQTMIETDLKKLYKNLVILEVLK